MEAENGIKRNRGFLLETIIFRFYVQLSNERRAQTVVQDILGDDISYPVMSGLSIINHDKKGSLFIKQAGFNGTYLAFFFWWLEIPS